LNPHVNKNQGFFKSTTISPVILEDNHRLYDVEES
jgi:hypothetical protein